MTKPNSVGLESWFIEYSTNTNMAFLTRLTTVASLLFLLVNHHVHFTCAFPFPYWTGSNIVGSRYGAVGAGGSAGGVRTGSVSSVYPTSMANLPTGMVMVGGEIVDTTNKLIQRVTGVGGTTYYSYLNQKSGPIFQTPTVDTGKHFVMFQDANYPPGDGHYIVLRRWRGMPMGGVSMGGGGVLYEAFYLDLGDSVNALVSNWNLATYVPGGGRGYQSIVGNTVSSLMNGGMGLRTGMRAGLNRLARDVAKDEAETSFAPSAEGVSASRVQDKGNDGEANYKGVHEGSKKKGSANNPTEENIVSDENGNTNNGDIVQSRVAV